MRIKSILIDLVCQYCAEPFVYRSRLSRPTQPFCSLKCAVRSRPPRPRAPSRHKLRPQPIDRFWSYVQKSEDPDGCWLWTGTPNDSGYGVITWHGRTRLAHRVAWVLVNGPFNEELRVLHKCDNPPCVNAERHLFLGTDADNVHDAMAKGRHIPPPRSVSKRVA